jgi:hypothetical protein
VETLGFIGVRLYVHASMLLRLGSGIQVGAVHVRILVVKPIAGLGMDLPFN